MRQFECRPGEFFEDVREAWRGEGEGDAVRGELMGDGLFGACGVLARDVGRPNRAMSGAR